MPSIDGGDNTSKDYAPHMWVGDHFIGGTGQKLKIGDWTYRGGQLSNDTFVAERYQSEGLFDKRNIELLEQDDIPAELIEKIGADARARHEALMQMMQRSANGG